jgi:hypothetical protein
MIEIVGNLAMEAAAERTVAMTPPAASVRRARTLLGWLNEQEGVTALLGRPPVHGEDISAARDIWRAARNAVEGRTPHVPAGVIAAVSDRRRLDALAGRAEVAAHFSGLNWRPEMVHLEHVLSFQKTIVLDGADERIGAADKDELELLKLCIPSSHTESPAEISTDPDGKGFAISSLNPNLRIAAAQASDAEIIPAIGMPPTKVVAFTIFAFSGFSYLQVVRYRDRCFVRCACEVYHPAIRKVIRIRGDEFVVGR